MENKNYTLHLPSPSSVPDYGVIWVNREGSFAHLSKLRVKNCHARKNQKEEKNIIKINL